MGRYSVSAGAVVFRADGRLLAVQRRDTGAWVTPGGIVEPGEPIREAAAREVFEETRVRVDVGPLTGVYQNLSTDVVTFVFRGRPLDDREPTSSEESARVRWLTLAEAFELMTGPFATRVSDAVAPGPGQPPLRTIAEPHLMAAKSAVGPPAGGSDTTYDAGRTGG